MSKRKTKSKIFSAIGIGWSSSNSNAKVIGVKKTEKKRVLNKIKTYMQIKSAHLSLQGFSGIITQLK